MINTAKRMLLVCAAIIPSAHLLAEDLKVETAYIRLSEDVDVPARAPGVLVTLNAQEGDAVKRDDLLGKIDDSEQRLEADRKRLDLEMAVKQAENRSNLDFAVKEVAIFEEQLTRAQNSRQANKNSVTLKEIEEFKLSYERAAVDVKRAKHDLEMAELMRDVKKSELALAEQQLERRTIRSPIDGIVSVIDRQAGEWIQPGERLVRIVRLDLLRVEGFIDARAATQPLVGADVSVTVEGAAGKSMQFEGKLSFIDPEVEPATGQVRVRAEIPNRDLLLRPGMRAAMVIHVAPTTDTNDAGSSATSQNDK